jgi:8-oxo-dGTP pyrophosphatase MutT (NUDIX family)
MRTNKRVGALMRRGDKVLLIHRFKNGEEYWVLPGGGVEDEESLEIALAREVMEETSLEVDSFALLGMHDHDDGSQHIFYEVITSGEPVLGGPEKENMNDRNVYILEWVDKEIAKSLISLFPEEVRAYF